jgi:voltage-gated potassium channel
LSASWRDNLISHIHPGEWVRPGLSPFSIAVIGSILLAVTVQVLETESSLTDEWGSVFSSVDLIVGFVFIIDFTVRWQFPAEPQYTGIVGKLKYLVKPGTLVDLLAILPFIIHPYLELLEANDLAFLRTLQLIKIMRIADLGPVSRGMDRVGRALATKKVELTVTFALAFVSIIAAATLLYLVEATTQPDAFGSIPRALWWSLATLTTVGYGDVAPITPLGKILGGFVAILGVGIIAMPAGILASSFSSIEEGSRENK